MPDLKPGYNLIRTGRGNETMFEKGLLAGKRILVTGGGSGLGAPRWDAASSSLAPN